VIVRSAAQEAYLLGAIAIARCELTRVFEQLQLAHAAGNVEFPLHAKPRGDGRKEIFDRVDADRAEPIAGPVPAPLEPRERVRAVLGIRELCISTNGILLEAHAEDLIALGITRFNVSVDTLDPERFRSVTRGGDLGLVWRGVEALLAAEAAGAKIRVKLNAVLMRGVNEGEVEAFARLTYRHPLHVRFIELMPLAHCGEVHDDRYVSSAFVVETLERMGAARLIARERTDGPALAYQLRGALGTVGAISPVSETHFCDRCNRVRLGADGQLKLCLFGDERVDLRAVVRWRPRVEGDLDRALLEAMERKPEKMAGFSGFTMMSIGR
jgi:cyclic pyranopterin phosphate synthase